ncbi:hypothetical protein [Paenarthrobacter sp. NPDC058040]|uniref:hypothetical protein n=1 Tax=unclassified Paenarthrobacter TaxID=2634190 RepID=UPI0036DA33CC
MISQCRDRWPARTPRRHRAGHAFQEGIDGDGRGTRVLVSAAHNKATTTLGYFDDGRSLTFGIGDRHLAAYIDRPSDTSTKAPAPSCPFTTRG